MVEVDEARRASGLEPYGDERGEQTIAEALAGSDITKTPKPGAEPA